jgi:hypothetical protein
MQGATPPPLPRPVSTFGVSDVIPTAHPVAPCLCATAQCSVILARTCFQQRTLWHSASAQLLSVCLWPAAQCPVLFARNWFQQHTSWHCASAQLLIVPSFLLGPGSNSAPRGTVPLPSCSVFRSFFSGVIQAANTVALSPCTVFRHYCWADRLSGNRNERMKQKQYAAP